ncbi:hypothetical protein ACMFMG_005230 [Clarireedia jacksonii]
MFRIQSAVVRLGLSKGPNTFHHWQCWCLADSQHGTKRLLSRIPPLKKEAGPLKEEEIKDAVEDTKPKRKRRTPAEMQAERERIAALGDVKPKRKSRSPAEMQAEPERIAALGDVKPKRKRRSPEEMQAERERIAALGDVKPKRKRRSPAEMQAERERIAALGDVKPKRKSRSSEEMQAELEAEGEIEAAGYESKPRRKQRKKAANEAQIATTRDIVSDSTTLVPTDNVEVKRRRGNLKHRHSIVFEESLNRLATLEVEGGVDQARGGESLSDEQVAPLLVTGEEKRKNEDFIELDPVLMRDLAKAWGGKALVGDRSRVNIVHEKLCDDILDRLKPSLIKHTGCDIIDINPGVGIWSSKLHNLLKPRTHILMENDVKRYSPYLQPLLDEKDSTFKLIPKHGTVWGHLETAMTPEYLPHQEKLPRGDPKLNQPNDTLLLIANLAHHPRKVFRGFPSLSMLVTYQLLSAARSHALFHKYGLVRMLLWVPDEEKSYLLPRHVHSIRKSSIEAQVTCESISEIASSTEDTTRFLRDQSFALADSVEVVKKMINQGITTPAHRQGEMEKTARQIVAGATHKGFDETHRFKRVYSSQLEDLQRRFDKGEIPMRLDPDPENPDAIPPFHPDWVALIRLSSKVRQNAIQTLAHDKLIDEYMEINDLHTELKSADPDAEATQEAKKALDGRIKAWVTAIEGMHTATWHHFIVRFDSRRVTTPFEKREMEPLKAYSKEFHPPSNTALIDFQPKAIWPSLAKHFPENYDVFEYIIGNMYSSPTQSVKDAFTNLWPGAYEQLRDNCPSLTDAKKGGSFDLRYLTVRSLTMEMLQEITEAWLKWPFKPTRFDLMKRSGSEIWDPDSKEEFDGSSDNV